MEIERRFFDTGPLAIEMRGEGDAKTPCIRGYAALFNSLSLNLGGFREQLLPGAFDGVLEDDVRALYNHDANQVLGRTKASTLKIGVDSRGLWYEIDVPDTTAARDLMVSIKRGDVSQSSFGFSVAPGGADWSEDDTLGTIRSIAKVGKLYDVSPVTYPAYPDTEAACRSLENWRSQSSTAQRERDDAKQKTQHEMESRSRELILASFHT